MSTASGQAGGSTTSGNPTGFDKTALLENLGNGVIIPTYRDFADATALLEQRAAQYRDQPTVENRNLARQAWRDAMDIWQRAELMQLGPAGNSGQVPGGEDLRDEIYSWPLVNRCRVDQELVEANYDNVMAFGNEQINVRGLDALEYLLFSESISNACPPQNVINAEGSWDPIVDELDARRAAYAFTLAQLLNVQASALRDAWLPTGGNFVRELAAADGGGSVYGSAQEALNGVSDAMFYFDSTTKDVKLAIPVGLTDCVEATCPQNLESTVAGVSKQEIRANVVGFQLLFHGGAPDGDALGFDDWLQAAGAPELSDEITTNLAAALAAIDAIEEDDLADALEQDKQSIEDVYFALKAVADLLKTQFNTVLDLDLPQNIQGDND